MDPKDRKVAVASAAALLMASRKSKRDLSDAADDVLDDLHTSVLDRPKNKPQIQQAILRTARILIPALTAALVLSGRHSADIARARLSKELEAAGLDVELPQIVQLGRFIETESVWASSAAESLAASWRNRALSNTGMALRKETSVSKALRDSRKGIQSSLDRTAITETTRVYNEAHLEELRHAMDHSPDVRKWVEQNSIMREWVALLDACDDCRDLDGTQVGIDEDFPGGAEPPAHPRCRCHVAIVISSSTKAVAA